MSRVRAVLFDVGGTLVQVEPSVGAVYSETARAHGVIVDPEQVNDRFRGAWKRSLARSRARGFACSDVILREEWRTIVGEVFDGVVSDDELLALFDDLYDRFATKEVWTVAPQVRRHLDWLNARGVQLGVLSNWDSRLGDMLEALDLSDAFAFSVVSHSAGVEKPHPEIFRRALSAAGTNAPEAVMVGDSWENDVSPARELGMRVVWVTRDSAAKQNDLASSCVTVEAFPADPEELWGRWLA